MATKITRDILESYLHCKLKGISNSPASRKQVRLRNLLTERGPRSGSPLSTRFSLATQAKRYPGTSP